MSKSDDSQRSRIEITDSADTIMFKMKKATTDFSARVSYEPETRPGVSNLVSIHSLLTNCSTSEICENVKNLNTGQ